MNIQPRFTFDRPVHDFEALKPRLLRAANIVLAKTDELSWKGQTKVGFQGVINFEVTFPACFKKSRVVVNPLEVFQALNSRADEFHKDVPDIVMIRAKLNELKDSRDLVNFMDYLDDYSEALNESKEDRNKYFYGLFVKVAHSLKYVEMPVMDYFSFIDYNGAKVIRQARLSKKLDAVWINFEKIKPYLPIDAAGLIEQNLKSLNYSITEYPETESLDSSIESIEPLIKDSLAQKTVDFLLTEAEKTTDKLRLASQRSRILLADLSERTMRYKLALFYIECINRAESAKIEPHPKIRVNMNFSFRLKRLNSILSFLYLHLDKYPASIDTESVERVTRLEGSLVTDPDVVQTFQRFVQMLTKVKQMHPRAHSAQVSLLLNLKRNRPLETYENIITLYKYLT